MTPERKAYLDRCSKWERKLRSYIKNEKMVIKHRKWCLSISNIDYDRQRLKMSQRYLQMYRHELNRLKGMDRATSIYRTYDKETGLTSCFCSNCDRAIEQFDNYCGNCGKHFLWEK